MVWLTNVYAYVVSDHWLLQMIFHILDKDDDDDDYWWNWYFDWNFLIQNRNLNSEYWVYVRRMWEKPK